MPLTIGFCGLAGSGKSTAALRLVERHGFERRRFAGPLKAMIAALGLGHEEIEGQLKEVPSPLLCGRTPRQAMQWLGTEWGRNLIGEDFWTLAWETACGDAPLIVADDCRFANEADAIRRRGGIVIRIDCPWAVSSSGAGHASEALAFEPDLVVSNHVAGDPEPMHAAIWRAVEPRIAHMVSVTPGTSAA